jgi:hypothetical protein
MSNTTTAAFEARRIRREERHDGEIAEFQDKMDQLRATLEINYANQEATRPKGTQQMEYIRTLQLSENAHIAREKAREAFNLYAETEDFQESRIVFKNVKKLTKDALHKQSKSDAVSDWFIAEYPGIF